MNKVSSRGHEPIVKLLIGITLLGLSICLGIEADSVFEFAINGPAGAALSAAVGYTGGILLCSYFSGMLFRRSLRSQLEQSDRKISLRYIQPFLLAVAAVILLPLVLFAATYAYPTDLGRSISITVAPALIVALTSAMITLVFYFLGPGERIAGQYGEPTSGEGPRMSAARLRSRRRSIIRIYLQRAS